MILNLKDLNEDVEFCHFKMQTFADVLKLFKSSCYMTSLDVKDAYYTIPVVEEYQKYLKFMWKGKLYKFCVLPNGLSLCPRWFTKLLKYPMGNLKELMHILSSYIDDIYLQGDSECIQNIADTITLLHKLGFTLHPDKFQSIPSTEVKTLGFIVDSVEMRVTYTLTQGKTENILWLLKHNLRKNVIKIREFARIIGKLVAAFPASIYGPSHFELRKGQNNCTRKGK